MCPLSAPHAAANAGRLSQRLFSLAFAAAFMVAVCAKRGTGCASLPARTRELALFLDDETDAPLCCVASGMAVPTPRVRVVRCRCRCCVVAAVALC
jgi:hypothetical protein